VFDFDQPSCGRLYGEPLAHAFMPGRWTFSRARRRSPCDSGSVTRVCSIPPRVCIKVTTRGAEPNCQGDVFIVIDFVGIILFIVTNFVGSISDHDKEFSDE
jgi:hypothetical protein